MSLKAYYAHSQAIYGTPQEERDHRTIRELGYEPMLFGPVTQRMADEAKAQGQNAMDVVFRPMVENCDILFFRALPDGRIPAGVYKEIIYAREAGIPVLELPSGIHSREMSVSDTREYLKEVGQR
jgi:hypothetical protein